MSVTSTVSGGKIRSDGGHELKAPQAYWKNRPGESDEAALQRVERFRRIACAPATRKLGLLAAVLGVAAEIAESWLDAHPENCGCEVCEHSPFGGALRRDVTAAAWSASATGGFLLNQLHGDHAVRVTTVPDTLKKLAKKAARLDKRTRGRVRVDAAPVTSS